MHFNTVHVLREKLRLRYRFVLDSHSKVFHSTLIRFWQYLHCHDLLSGVMQQLEACSIAYKTEAESIIHGGTYLPQSEEQEACVAYLVIKHCAASEAWDAEYQIGRRFLPAGEAREFFKIFCELFVRPLYHYVDEQLDDQRAVLGLLRRYKHHCEWFHHEKLRETYESEQARSVEFGKKSRAEKMLALHLYEYLHAHGVSFSIQPWSISGEADLIAAQGSDDPLVADAKVFDGSKDKITRGFQQVFRYTCDFNEPFGYLVIYKVCEQSLMISSDQQEQSTSFLTYGGKTIFFVVVDLFAYVTSASQRPRLKGCVIKQDEIISLIDDPGKQENSTDSISSVKQTIKGLTKTNRPQIKNAKKNDNS